MSSSKPDAQREATRLVASRCASGYLFRQSLKVAFAGICVKQVNLVSIDVQPDMATWMGLRTRIEPGNNLFAANGHINQQFISQVFHNIYSSIDSAASLSIR